ncbi:NTP transferase domain-containing protein [Helicobacter kayseriensis]|uniref:NTP transferase domain-containing protein n=1 Tax=Helicobacter kayseriensis TaxID=2905877 RepID=UPI001E5E1BC2|nr:NTP transferase domain-containing protein [Helicobacter kayseriensis]MCE3047158.1 NTP transferase domain-containing protein [Helicobacter kayseriensis]
MITRPCVILCGGKSSRMGENKALLSFGGRTLLGFLIKKYQMIFEKVYLCCKQEHVKFYERLGVSLLIEKSPIFSPMIGLQMALQNLSQNPFIVSVDCPFLQEEHFLQIQKKFLECNSDIVYAKTLEKSHFLIGIYTNKVLPILREKIQKEDYKMSSLIQVCCADYVLFDSEESFSNLNTKEDYVLALERIKNGI